MESRQRHSLVLFVASLLSLIPAGVALAAGDDAGHTSDLLSGIGLSIIAATALAFVAHALRQPLLLGYLAAGVLLGPEMGFGLISDHATIELIAEVGLILLLFIIGLEIDLKKLRLAGRSVVLTGALQFVGCVALGLSFVMITGLAGEGRYDAFYLAVTMALSSTMIVVKLLYDKFELGTLPGRLTLGVLVFQDLWAILVLAVQPSLDNPDAAVLLKSFLAGTGLVVASLACSRYLLPPLFARVAKLPEVMLIAALAWCFLVSSAASAAGLSREMGALIAGVSISTFPYNMDVVAKVVNIRDFFVTLFFVSLGMTIQTPTLPVVASAVLLSLFLMASRLLTVFPLLYATGNGLRASLLPSVNLAQMSEFSLVIANLAVGFGHIGEQTVAVLTFVFAITAVLSTYAITYNHPIQYVLARPLRALGLRDPEAGSSSDDNAEAQPAIVFLGFFREASSILEELCDQTKRVPRERLLVVDFNPNVHRELNRRGIRCLYGDVASMETLHHAHIARAELVVCSIVDTILRGTNNERMLRQLRRLAPKSQVIVASETIAGALELYEHGADFVLVPRLHSAAFLADVIVRAIPEGLAAIRNAEIAQLRRRDEVLP